MNSYNIERAFSKPRFYRYLAASNGNWQTALELYRTNVRLSSRFFAILNVFEVVFRNAINEHYINQFGKNWLFIQSAPKGFLANPGCEKSRKTVLEAIQKLGNNYSQDKMVAACSFGFWRFLFASKEFSAAGSTLLRIFPNKPKGGNYNHTYVFNELFKINEIRNRIAHHEPICFAPQLSKISCWPVVESNSILREMLEWLDFEPRAIFLDIDFIYEELRHLANKQ
ncbi:MAG: Abi family protein [Saprospiraceae bacterium]|jgi:hypothetical protein|nr:Abi family protein [Lewinellaceae bacterium]